MDKNINWAVKTANVDKLLRKEINRAKAGLIPDVYWNGKQLVGIKRSKHKADSVEFSKYNSGKK